MKGDAFIENNLNKISKNKEKFMKKIKYTTKLMMATSLLSLFTIGTVNAKEMSDCKNQMNTDCMQEMKSDSMKKDGMMKSDSMKKDEMMKSDSMKKDEMMKSDSMQKDGMMKSEPMKKSSM